MTRSRRNRRRKLRAKRPVRMPRWPKLALEINWKAVLLPPLAVACVGAAAVAAEPLLDRPVGKLVIEGTFQRVTPIQIEAALAPELAEGFLTLDLEPLRHRIEELPWVDSARLRRAWPDALVVEVVEHRAAARWGDTGLLNVRGELFAERPEHAFPELPKLAGPEGSERDVAGLYLTLRDRLATAHLDIESLSMDDRGAWRLVLSTGQEVRLGRHDVAERLDRFFGVVAPALATELHRIRYVDLRYTNGFAVGWAGDGEEATDVAARKEAGGHG